MVKRTDSEELTFYETDKIEVLKFGFISIFYIIGFFVLYLGKLNLNLSIYYQSIFFELFISKIQNLSISEFFLTYFHTILYLILALICFSFGLTFLAVKKLGNIKYFFILIFLPFGILFNYSILFIFFSIGLYLASLLVISFGDAYEKELRKWKTFRVGSNATTKTLFVLFLFVLIGSFISFYFNNSYKENFINSTISSLENIVLTEVKNFSTKNTTEILNTQMEIVRSIYPNLTEEQYREIENNIKAYLPNTSVQYLSSEIRDKLENSLIIKSLLIWFPFFMSISIWLFLEFLRIFLLSPISGVFSFLFYKLKV